VIPAEAVEAAAKAWVSHSLKPGSMTVEDGMREILEAAAPYMQPALDSVEDLDALPEGAMVRTDTGFYLKEALRNGFSTWVTTNEQYYFKTEDITLPATVIYLPYRSQA
jgi:hypothetical protein